MFQKCFLSLKCNFSRIVAVLSFKKNMNKKLYLSACICLIILQPFFLQGQQDAVDTNVIRLIRNEEDTRSLIPQIAHYLTDVSGSRLTNSSGFKIASAWAVQTMKDWGLSNAKLEPWGLFGMGWDIEQYYMSMTEPFYKPIPGYPRAWTPGSGGAIRTEAILLTRTDSGYLQNMAAAIKGKIVLIGSADTLLQAPQIQGPTRYADSVLSHLPETDMISKEVLTYYIAYYRQQIKSERQLQRLGALAMVTSNHTSRDGTFTIDGTQSFRENSPVTSPQININKEDFLMMQRLLTEGKKIVLNLDLKVKWDRKDLNGYNVIAEIPGSDPFLKEQVVMIGGHLDSWHAATGATDNAAGCAVMMEAARLIVKLNLHPRRTIRIALWSGEEEALLGSFNYVKKHFGNPADMKLTEEAKNISAYFNLDNGTGKIRGVYLQQNEAVRPVFKNWLAPFADLGATGITSSNTGSTDHISFDAVGIPAFQFIQDPLEYEFRTHHTNVDSYDHLQFKDLRQAAIIVASFAYNAAQRDELLPRKPLPKPQKFIFDIDLPNP